MKTSSSFRQYAASTILLMAAGWGGLLGLFLNSLPTVWPRWTFFLLCVMALTGTALPLAYLINRRAAGSPSPEPQLVVRQALWVGIFGATLAWLQLGRLASMWVILGLAGGLIAAEYFVRMRELARRRPRFGDQAFASADRHDAAP